MYKLLLTDLDETLLVNHRVPQPNIEAIKEARRQGVKVVPATGRGSIMITQILEDIDATNKEDEYSICYNGGLIIENKDHKILHFQGITYHQASTILEESKRFDICVLLFTLEKCYIFNPSQSELDRKAAQKAPYEVLQYEDIIKLKDEKIAKILYAYPDMERLKNIAREIQEMTDRLEVTVSFSSNRYLECNAKGIDKGFGLHWLANYLGINNEEVIAVGDNYNDVEMIQEAGLGIAVANATEDIKELADYVTKNTYEQYAIKEIIEEVILGKDNV